MGAAASQLAHALHVTNVEVGLLASAVSFAAAIATLPIGVVSDRLPRVPLLAGSVALWSIAMLVGGAAGSYEVLLVSRLFLGGVQATSGPTLGSLIGDFFPAGDRGRINGYILSGELVGGGLGFVVCGEIAAALTWRWAFWALILPGLVLSVLLWRLLPEPERGRMSRLTGSEPSEDSLKKVAARRLGSARGPVLAEDPRRMNLWRAVRYVCRSARTSR